MPSVNNFSKSSEAFRCIRAGISSDNNSISKSGIILTLEGSFDL
jgi:hypothetical protein